MRPLYCSLWPFVLFCLQIDSTPVYSYHRLERFSVTLTNKYNVLGTADDIRSTSIRLTRHGISRVLRPAVIVGCIYLLFIMVDALMHGHSALFYVHIGPRFILHDPHAAPGYDGQFYYQIAHDPLHASRFIDHPAYRYERIVYPLIVGILSLGQASLIPYMLLLVNFVSIVLGTELLARLFMQQRLSPWFSLAFGLYFGQATAFIFDTTEPLTYFFVCLGLFLLLRQRLTSAAIMMGLAVLSRETAVLFPLGYIVLYLLQRRWQDGLRLFLLSILPTALWYLVIALLFQANSLATSPAFQLIPFQGLFVFAHDSRRFMPLIILMFIPCMLKLVPVSQRKLCNGAGKTSPGSSGSSISSWSLVCHVSLT